MSDAAYLRHIEAAARPPALAGTAVDNAAILDAGMLGIGLAAALLEAGIATTLIETDAGAAERASHALDRMIARRVEAGEITALDARRQLQRCRVTTEWDGVAQVVFAYAPAFAKLTYLPKLCVSLSDPGTLATTPHPDRTVAMGLTAPVYATHVVELAPGAAAFEPLGLAQSLIASLSLLTVCSDHAIAPRLLDGLREISDTLLMDATTPWELDEAMRDFGFATGVYEAQDDEGLDVGYARRRAATRDPARRIIPISDRMVAEGRLGRSVGVGWYRYPGGGGRVIDPLLEDMITEEAWFAKVDRVSLTPEEMMHRLLLGLINHAAGMLHAGDVGHVADIDILSVHALGFPRDRGGVLRYADQLGAGAVVAGLRALSREDPALWDPSPLLVEMARTGSRFTATEECPNAGCRGPSA